MKFVNVGFNNVINAERAIAVISSDSAPAKRLIQEAKDGGRAIDCTCGRKTRCIVIMDSDHIILSAIQNETISQRLGMTVEEGENEDE
ncbi:MAG: extracellular matrix/biofilm biosynthesis regulator RemA family protein [Eubacteriales bacterium]